MHRGHKYQVKMQKKNIAGRPVGMSLDVLLECPRTSFGDVLRVNVTERVWHSPIPCGDILMPFLGKPHLNSLQNGESGNTITY